MPQYNKLVRDKIPEIIKASGEHPITRILTDEEYAKALTAKIAEEQQELANATTPEEELEELADLYELVLAKAKQLATIEQLESIRAAKAAKRGGFEQRIFLERTE